MARIREATSQDVAALARAHVDTWRETYRGLLPDAYLAGLEAASREPQWQRVVERPAGQGCVFVAEDEQGAIIGFASGGQHYGTLGYTGELYTLYLRQGWQGQGLGRALFQAVATRLHEQGRRSLALWVLATNRRARDFYEAMGGRFVREQSIVFEDVPLREAGYGWRDITTVGRADRATRGEG
jgi:ribosomal protein S18 acetylase RimI-like enzyme